MINQDAHSTPSASETAFAFMKRHKLRVFIAASLGLHALVGLGWGVPAYIHDQKLKARQAEEARLLSEQQQALAAKVDDAKDKALDLARADVTRQLRATYDTIVRELTAPRQELLWDTTVEKLATPIDALAQAMGDTAVTEQDLRNMQADLNRQLVETVNRELAANIGKWTQDDFLAQVQEKLVPLLKGHYRRQLDTRVGKPMRDSANELINAARKDSPLQPTADGVAHARTEILSPFSNNTFDAAFGEHAAERISQALLQQILPTLQSRQIADDAFVASTRDRINELLRSEVLKDGEYGAAATDRLKDVGAANDSPEAAAVAARFSESVKPTAAAEIVAVAQDAKADVELIRKAAIKLSSKEDDVAYRVETMAQHAEEGRTVGGLDGIADSTFAQMREEALLRASEIALMGTDALSGMDASFMQDGEALPPSTQPMIDPLVEAAMQDVWRALQAEFDEIVGARRTPQQAKELWGRVQSVMAPDVLTFAEALLDPSLTASQLEAKRTDLNTRFAMLVRAALEATLAQELSDQLVEQIKGQAGEKIADAYKEPLKQSIGRELSRSVEEGIKQEKRSAVEEFAELKGAVDKAAQATAQVSQGVSQSTRKLGSLPKEASKRPAAVKSESEPIARHEEAIRKAAETVKAATEGKTYRSPETRQKLDDLKTALDAASGRLAEAKEASQAGTEAPARDAAKKASETLSKLGAAAKSAQTAVAGEIDEAARQYALAARRMMEQQPDTGATEPPTASEEPAERRPESLMEKVDEAFAESFTKQAIDPLVNEIVKKFEERLTKEGIRARPQEGLSERVREALEQKVDPAARPAESEGNAGEAVAKGGETRQATARSAGSVALSAVDKKVTRAADSAVASDPVKSIADKVDAAAEKIVEAGVKQATATLRGQQAIGGAVASAGAADAETKALHGDLVKGEAAARNGHGGVLADASGGNSLQDLRSKWLAAAGGAHTGTGGGEAAQANAAGEGSGASVAARNGAGSGANGARATGRGPGNASGRGIGYHRNVRLDREKLEALAEQSAKRGVVAGQELDRQGAAGEASRASATSELVVAAMLAPTTPPQQQVKNGEPFQPKFTTIRFATIPFLATPFRIDGNFEKWKDVPTLDLLPERFKNQGQEGVRVVEKLPAKVAWDGSGLYVMVDVVDSNGRIDLPAGANSFWSGDTVEVWVDMLNTKERNRTRGTGQQFWCWPFGDRNDPTLTGGESVIAREQWGYYPMGPSGMTRSAEKTEAGYRVEFHIPSARLRDAELVAGKILGLNINVETGSGDKIQYYWASSKAVATYTRPDTWGDVLLGGSDGTLEIPAKLTGEGTAAEAHETRNAFVIGEPMRLRVTDRDMNLNPQYRDKVAVTVRNPRGEQTVAVLEETTIDSGVFEGAVRTGLALGEAVPATLSVYEGESVRVTYVDQARGNGARNAELVYTVRAASPLTVGGPAVAAK